MGLTLKNKFSQDYDMGYMSFYRLRNDIAQFISETPKKGTISFLEQSDCEGKLTPKQCKDLLKDIKDMEDKGKYYGYLGRGAENCLTITKFKALLKECIDNKCKLKWI